MLINSNRQLAIKKYSFTYKTYWENKEGELTKEVIKRILNNQSFSDLFKVKNSRIYSSLYNLSEINLAKKFFRKNRTCC